MIIDDDNTQGGDLLVLAVPEKENMSDDYRTQVLLYTEDQKVIDAFEQYFADIWDQSEVLDSADELAEIEREALG